MEESSLALGICLLVLGLVSLYGATWVSRRVSPRESFPVLVLTVLAAILLIGFGVAYVGDAYTGQAGF